ncbi:MAG TPA: formate dehydrogenase subunit gamma [Longimicrobiales bacterium]|nr:formate dehydrogenase subunit gamma [Longimicrobiales bacterium]
MRRGELERFTYVERIVHWVVGLSFLALLLTGLAFSHPRLFWLTSLFGGGALARILHPWMGLVFSASAVAMLRIWMRDMRITHADRAWLRAIRHYAVHDKERVPPAGKYNAGQKLFFWAMGGLAALYLVSGVPLWLPGGALGLGPFYGGVVNFMRLLHYLATVVGGLLLIVHVYLGTVAYPGTLGAMLHGSVTRAWAKLHHPLWHEERSGR